MNEMVPSQLTALADLINTEHAAALGSLRTALGHARTAGELLLEAKQRCPHGAWLPWLKDNVAFSERTAQGYMRVTRRWPELEANPQVTADLTLDRALALLAAPSLEAAVDEDGRRACTCDWTDDDRRALVGLPPAPPLDPEAVLRFVAHDELPSDAEQRCQEAALVMAHSVPGEGIPWRPCCEAKTKREAVQKAHLLADLAEELPEWRTRETIAVFFGIDVVGMLGDILMFGDIPGGQAALRRLWPLLSSQRPVEAR